MLGSTHKLAAHMCRPGGDAKGKERRRSLGTAELIEFEWIEAERGSLSIAQLGKELPFAPRRLYWIHGGDAGMERGGHAHYTLKQLLIPMFGAFEIDVDNGAHQRTFVLDSANQGLLLYPVVWRDIR